MIRDSTGRFADIRFKIAVMSDIMEGPVGLPPETVNALDQIRGRYDDELLAVFPSPSAFEQEMLMRAPVPSPSPSPEIMRFIADLPLSQEALDSVQQLTFEAGGRGYDWVDADGGDWGGTDDRFTVQDVGGFEQLRNLTSVDLVGGSVVHLETLRPMAEAGIEIIATRHTLQAEGIDPETFPNLRIE